jgi:hypothetical protein
VGLAADLRRARRRLELALLRVVTAQPTEEQEAMRRLQLAQEAAWRRATYLCAYANSSTRVLDRLASWITDNCPEPIEQVRTWTERS